MKSRSLLIACCLLFFLLVNAQNEVKYQTVRGRVLDAQSQYPLIGVTVWVVNSAPLQGGVTDVNGYYKIDNIATGRIDLKFSFVGYKDQYVPNIPISVGKQTTINISLEESIHLMDVVVVEGIARTYEELNELASISVTGFNIGETER